MPTLSTLIGRYRTKGVLVDTNLLIAYLVGIFDRRQLANCRATKNFEPDDFDVLGDFLDQFEVVVTTPHILTEVSNLSGRLPESLHASFRQFSAEFVRRATEREVPAAGICREADFIRSGLADTAIMLLAPGSYLVLTDEFPLANTLAKRGVEVVNFNSIRPAGQAIL